MASFRGILHFVNGNASGKFAYIFNRDGVGGYALTAAPKIAIDQTQGYVEISTGVRSFLQFSVDTAASNLGQAYFGTFATAGINSCSGGVLEITESSGATKLFIIESGTGFYNGTDKLFFTLNALPGVLP